MSDTLTFTIEEYIERQGHDEKIELAFKVIGSIWGTERQPIEFLRFLLRRSTPADFHKAVEIMTDWAARPSPPSEQPARSPTPEDIKAAADLEALALLAAAKKQREAEQHKASVARRIEELRERNRVGRIKLAHTYAGEAWIEGTCVTCAATIPDWDKVVLPCDEGAESALCGSRHFVRQTPEAVLDSPWPYLAPAKYRCEPCAEASFLEARRIAAEEQRAKKEKARERSLADAWATLPAEGRDVSLANVVTSGRLADPVAATKASAHVMAESPTPPILLLVGHTGTGKTSLARALIQDMLREAENLDAPTWIVDRAEGARYYSIPYIARARMRSKLGSEAPEFDDAMGATVLVLDELGGENKMHADVIEELIFDRIDAGRPTIITTGLSSAAIMERYSAGLARRIAADKHVTHIVPCAPKKAATR